MGQAAPLGRPFIALVVEDEPDLRELATSLLEETELEVAEAESGEQALSFLRKRANEVAMVFTDVNLPGRLDGIDRRRSRCPFLAVDPGFGHVGWNQPAPDHPSIQRPVHAEALASA